MIVEAHVGHVAFNSWASMSGGGSTLFLFEYVVELM